MISYNKTDDDKKEYENVPARLRYKNNGGLRIPRSKYMEFIIYESDYQAN